MNGASAGSELGTQEQGIAQGDHLAIKSLVQLHTGCLHLKNFCQGGSYRVQYIELHSVTKEHSHPVCLLLEMLISTSSTSTLPPLSLPAFSETSSVCEGLTSALSRKEELPSSRGSSSIREDSAPLTAPGQDSDICDLCSSWERPLQQRLQQGQAVPTALNSHPAWPAGSKTSRTAEELHAVWLCM